MIELRNLFTGAAFAAAALLSGGESADAAANGLLVAPAATGNRSTCENAKCVAFSANSNIVGGNNNPSFATATFRTITQVRCSEGTDSGPQQRVGTAVNPDGGDYFLNCPGLEVGLWTAWAVDPL